ncbi:hypothetical protein V6N13_073972 [Hibiscus sabdariffa]
MRIQRRMADAQEINFGVFLLLVRLYILIGIVSNGKRSGEDANYNGHDEIICTCIKSTTCEEEGDPCSSPTMVHGIDSVCIKSDFDDDALDMGFNDIFCDT